MSRIFRLFCLIVCAALLLQPVAARAAWYWPFGGEGMEYAIRIDGPDEEMMHWLKKLKLNEPTEDHPPETMDALGQEANSLAGRVKKALEAKGYMESQAEPSVDSTTKPPVIEIKVEQGYRYPLGSVKLDWQGDPLSEPDLAQLKSKQGAPLDMLAIEEDAVTLMTLIGKDACLLSLAVAPKLQLHAESREAGLVFVVTHGPPAKFGPTVISGNEKVHDSVIQRTTKWQQGKCYDAMKVEDTRTALVENQLFSRVEITPPTKVDANGEAPIEVAVKERVARTIGAGVDYSTDVGAGVHGSWQHRNLWGDAEKLDVGVTVSQREIGANGTLKIPAFYRDDQALVLSSALKRQDTDAYTSLTLDNTARIERRLNKKLNVGLGVGYTLTNTEDEQNGNENYALLSFPAFAEYDSRNNALDARRGIFARLAATPYTETIGDGGQFLKLLGTAQTYISSDTVKYDPTLALRASVGSIQGSKGSSVPADIRFYAGGGGSVRGYSYQALSPQFNNSPIGGASIVEASAELRLRFTETIGAVTFLDAGNAYAASTPDVGETLYYGAGVGARYYSPIGPLRFDVAVPLNGKDIGQTGYQIYVSLGQSF